MGKKKGDRVLGPYQYRNRSWFVVLMMGGIKRACSYPSEQQARIARSWAERALTTMARQEAEEAARGS